MCTIDPEAVIKALTVPGRPRGVRTDVLVINVNLYDDEGARRSSATSNVCRARRAHTLDNASLGREAESARGLVLGRNGTLPSLRFFGGSSMGARPARSCSGSGDTGARLGSRRTRGAGS